MFDWNKAVRESFSKETKQTSIESLTEVIDETLSELRMLFEQKGGSLTLSSIPDIPVSEIGWSKLNTRDGVEVPSEARAQLGQFLDNIPGDDIQGKIKSLADFYNMDDATIKGLTEGTAAENISKTMSYLVFFKTLTQIITNFNAASAGFSFESFLAVLLGGKQIATGNQTIADLTDRNGTPISLKLYKEGNLEVGGSFTDLVVDLENLGEMQYICVTKDLTGDGLEQEGRLTFYRFNFNLDNTFNIIARSSKESQKNILLPKIFIDSNGENMEGVPEKRMSLPSAEELEAEYLELLRLQLDAAATEIAEEVADLDFSQLAQEINYAKNDPLFSPIKVGGEAVVIRAKSNMRARDVALLMWNKFLKDNDRFPKPTSRTTTSSALVKSVIAANEKLKQRYARDEQAKARQAVVNDMYFYPGVDEKERIEISRKFYEEASPDLKRKCLLVSHGYVTTGHFNLTQTMVERIDQIAQPTPGDLFPEGQSNVLIGTLEIGASKIQNVLDEVVEIFNRSIFDIFNNLKSLTSNIQGYFAGGLQSGDPRAKEAIVAADNIGEKTAEVSGQGGERGTQTAVPGGRMRLENKNT